MHVTEAMRPAWERMKDLLFRPFHLGTWFSLGFAFFLQSCVEGSGGPGNIPNLLGDRGKSNADTTESIGALFADHAGSLAPSGGQGLDGTILAVIVGVGIVVAIPVLLLAIWLGTRGQLMSIRSVATGRTDVSESWAATGQPASALFKFHLVLGLVNVALLVPIVGVGAWLLIPLMRAHATRDELLPYLLGIGAVAVVVMLPFGIVRGITRNFVAPLMLKHGIGAREGWRRFWAVGRDHVGSMIGFFLLRALVGVGALLVGMVASVLTCCLGFLPILNQTLMAPWHVFERAWAIESLASLGPDFDVRGLSPEAPNAPPPPNGGGFYAHAVVPPEGASGAVPNPYMPPGYGEPPP